MKLDTTHMRYLTKPDFKVLQAMETGSKNHDVVPTTLIETVSGLRSPSQVKRSISTLAKIKLLGRQKNAKYDGYRLTYLGYDYLALKTLLQRGSIYAVGTQIGIGKESDIFSVANTDGKKLCLKIHRLGRISFRNIKNTRDYLGNRQSASWMYLSRLAAEKEYGFMTALYDAGFSVPTPVDQSRHQVLMGLIDGIPMRALVEHPDPLRLYTLLMDFILRLANHGIIHCDFNEFNIMVCEYDPEHPESEAVIIDFPQCVSIDHKDAQSYFERDVNCIRRFFAAKFNFEADYPRWKDVKREAHLDVAANASGNDKKAYRELEKHLQKLVEEGEEKLEFTEDEEIAENEAEDEEEEELDEEEDEEEEDEEEEEDDEEEEEPKILSIGSLSSSPASA